MISLLADYPHFIPVLARWLYDEWGRNNPAASLEGNTALLREQCRRDELPITLVAVNDSKPVGTATVRLWDLASRPDLSPWLASVFVQPERRGRGLGKQLVRAAETHAVRLGVTTLHLFTYSHASFYTGLGWRYLATDENRGQSVIVLSKQLLVGRLPSRKGSTSVSSEKDA